jgi:hypothetical protein
MCILWFRISIGERVVIVVHINKSKQAHVQELGALTVKVVETSVNTNRLRRKRKEWRFGRTRIIN